MSDNLARQLPYRFDLVTMYDKYHSLAQATEAANRNLKRGLQKELVDPLAEARALASPPEVKMQGLAVKYAVQHFQVCYCGCVSIMYGGWLLHLDVCCFAFVSIMYGGCAFDRRLVKNMLFTLCQMELQLRRLIKSLANQ